MDQFNYLAVLISIVLGLTFVPAMAIEAGILEGTGVDVRPLRSKQGFRRIALVWRRSSPREQEFRLLAGSLRQIASDVVPGLASADEREAAARAAKARSLVPSGFSLADSLTIGRPSSPRDLPGT